MMLLTSERLHTNIVGIDSFDFSLISQFSTKVTEA